MSDSITTEEATALKSALRKLYGPQVDRWQINGQMFELFGRLIEKTRGCDKAMDLVPRPFGGGNAVKWASKQARQAITRLLKRKEAEHYIACMRAAAIGMKSDFYLAAVG